MTVAVMSSSIRHGFESTRTNATTRRQNSRRRSMTTNPELKFDSIHEAEYVLKVYTTAAKLRRLSLLGVDLTNYTHSKLGAFVGASREKVTRAMVSMGIRGRQRRKKTLIEAAA